MLARAVALDPVGDKTQDHWPRIAVGGDRAGDGLVDGNSDQAPAGRKIDRKAVPARLKNGLAVARGVLHSDMKLINSWRGAGASLHRSCQGVAGPARPVTIRNSV